MTPSQHEFILKYVRKCCSKLFQPHSDQAKKLIKTSFYASEWSQLLNETFPKFKKNFSKVSCDTNPSAVDNLLIEAGLLQIVEAPKSKRQPVYKITDLFIQHFLSDNHFSRETTMSNTPSKRECLFAQQQLRKFFKVAAQHSSTLSMPSELQRSVSYMYLQLDTVLPKFSKKFRKVTQQNSPLRFDQILLEAGYLKQSSNVQPRSDEASEEMYSITQKFLDEFQHVVSKKEAAEAESTPQQEQFEEPSKKAKESPSLTQLGNEFMSVASQIVDTVSKTATSCAESNSFKKAEGFVRDTVQDQKNRRAFPEQFKRMFLNYRLSEIDTLYAYYDKFSSDLIQLSEDEFSAVLAEYNIRHSVEDIEHILEFINKTQPYYHDLFGRK